MSFSLGLDVKVSDILRDDILWQLVLSSSSLSWVFLWTLLRCKWWHIATCCFQQILPKKEKTKKENGTGACQEYILAIKEILSIGITYYEICKIYFADISWWSNQGIFVDKLSTCLNGGHLDMNKWKAFPFLHDQTWLMILFK